MNADSIQDSTRVVVSALRYGAIIPNTRAEMWRDVFLLPGADLRGGIFCNHLNVEGGDVQVREAVYARGEVRVSAAAPAGEAAAKQPVTFHSAIVSGDAIKVESGTFKTRLLSNVHGRIVNLDGAIVFGNIYATRVSLKNCVVLGGVFAKGALTVQNSVLATFTADNATLHDHTRLLFPAAMARAELRIAGSVEVLAGLDLSKPDTIGGGAVSVTQADVYAVRNPTPEDGAPANVQLLSLNQRVLEGEELLGAFARNKRVLDVAALWPHLPKREQDAAYGGAGAELEARLTRLLETPTLPRLEGYARIETLYGRPEIEAALRRFSDSKTADYYRDHSRGERSG